MLPNDALRLVMRHHWTLYHARENAIRSAHRACMRELNAVCNHLYSIAAGWLMDHESGEYGYLLDDVTFKAEVDDYLISRPHFLLEIVQGDSLL